MNVIGVIKLLIFFIGFVIVCEALGLTLLKKINIKHNIIALPIGMALFGSLYEILVLPVQYFHLDSSLLKYALIITIIIIFFYGRKEIINIKNYLSKRDMFLLLIFIILFVIKALDLDIYGVDSTCGDIFYYIPLINGVSIDGIAVNGANSNISIGNSYFTSPNYAFYGQMHFLGAISNLLSVKALLTINFFQAWYLLVFYITNIYNICLMCGEYNLLNNINKYFGFIFLSVFFLSEFSVSQTICTNTTNMIFLSSFLLFYLKDNNKGWLVLFSFFSFHAISTRSSYIFLLSFFLLPYYLYLFINDKFFVKENVYIISPILFSLFVYLSYGKSVVVLIGLLLVLLIIIIYLPKLVKYIGDKKTKVLYYSVLICFFISFVLKSFSLGNIISSWDGKMVYKELFDSYFGFVNNINSSNSLYNFSYLLFGIILLIICIKNKNKTSYCVIHNIVIFILCLNPLVAPSLASLLPSVYTRLFSQWINPLYYLLLFNEFIGIFNTTVIKKTLNILLSIFLIINITFVRFSQYVNFIIYTFNTFKEERNNVSLYYKIGKKSYEIGIFLDDYAIEHNKKYILVALPTNVINSLFISENVRISPVMGDVPSIPRRFMSTDIYKQQYNEDNYQYAIFFYLLEPYRFFDDWHFENEPENIPDLESLFKKNDAEVFVINKWSNREEQSHYLNDYLNSFSQILVETDEYIICALK